MHFDIFTAMLLTAALTLLVGVALAFGVRRYPRPLHTAMRYWIWSLLVQPPGFAFLALRGVIPDLLSIVVANLLIALACGFQVQAIRAFYGRPAWRWVGVLIGLVGLVEIAFTWIWYDMGLRVIGFSLGLAAMLWMSVTTIYTQRGRLRPPEHLTGGVLLVVLTVLVVRIVVTLVDATPTVSLTTPTLLQGLVFATASLASPLATVGFVLMCGDRLNEELARLAMLDPLTGAHNRRTLEDLATRAIGTARRLGRPLALLTVDVDHFKRINDEFGHQAGDDALCALVGTLRALLRDGDVLSRIGGEEFVVLLPDTDEAGAIAIAERLRDGVRHCGFSVSGWPVPLRVSIGVGMLGDGVEDLATLMRVADRALYAAKRGGRDRVERAHAPTPGARRAGDRADR